MTPTRWNELLQFASETGLKIALGLNGCYGRMSSTSLMDLSNIKALLQATVTSPYAATGLWGFEFSNEVVPNTISPAAWAADMTAIKVRKFETSSLVCVCPSAQYSVVLALFRANCLHLRL